MRANRPTPVWKSAKNDSSGWPAGKVAAARAFRM
jgi:hypothetical protein